MPSAELSAHYCWAGCSYLKEGGVEGRRVVEAENEEELVSKDAGEAEENEGDDVVALEPRQPLKVPRDQEEAGRRKQVSQKAEHGGIRVVVQGERAHDAVAAKDDLSVAAGTGTGTGTATAAKARGVSAVAPSRVAPSRARAC